MNRITLNDEDFKKLITNNLVFNNLNFSEEDLLNLISGEIVEIQNNLIILQDIGLDKIVNILDKNRKI